MSLLSKFNWEKTRTCWIDSFWIENSLRFPRKNLRMLQERYVLGNVPVTFMSQWWIHRRGLTVQMLEDWIFYGLAWDPTNYRFNDLKFKAFTKTITKKIYYFQIHCNHKFSLKKDTTPNILLDNIFLFTERSWPVATIINVPKLHPFFSLSHMEQICFWNKTF